jgi:hypothetical protein
MSRMGIDSKIAEHADRDAATVWAAVRSRSILWTPRGHISAAGFIASSKSLILLVGAQGLEPWTR